MDRYDIPRNGYEKWRRISPQRFRLDTVGRGWVVSSTTIYGLTLCRRGEHGRVRVALFTIGPLFNIDVLRVPDLGGYGRLRNRDHNLAQLSIPLPHLKGHKLHHRFMMVPFPGGTLLDGWYMDGERSVRLVLNIGGP